MTGQEVTTDRFCTWDGRKKIPMGKHQHGGLRSRWHNNMKVNLRGGWEMNGMVQIASNTLAFLTVETFGFSTVLFHFKYLRFWG